MKKVLNYLLSSSIFLASPLWAQEVPPTPAPVSSKSVQEALRAQAEQILQAAELRYTGEEAQCHERFFVFRCIDEAQSKRLTQIEQARALRQQADRLKLLDKYYEAQADAQAQAERQAENAAQAAEPPAPPRPLPAPPKPLGKPSTYDAAQKAAQRRQAEEAAARRAAEAEQTRQAYDARRAAREAEKANKATKPNDKSISPF
jgi:colicin import membrane protein